jgi:hypothetical protein
MKEVIRLTESDITRIVRRVIKEQSSEVIKVRGWDTVDGRTKQSYNGYNLNVNNLHLENKIVRFNYTIPGTTTKGFGLATCGNTGGDNNTIAVNMNNKAHQLYLTPEGYKKITKLCDSYVSNGTKMNGDYV